MKIKNKKHYDEGGIEVVHDIIRKLEEMSTEAKEVYFSSLTRREKAEALKNRETRFAAIAELLIDTLGYEVRTDDGMLYTQVLFNKIFYYRQTAEIDKEKEGEEFEIGRLKNEIYYRH